MGLDFDLGDERKEEDIETRVGQDYFIIIMG